MKRDPSGICAIFFLVISARTCPAVKPNTLAACWIVSVKGRSSLRVKAIELASQNDAECRSSFEVFSFAPFAHFRRLIQRVRQHDGQIAQFEYDPDVVPNVMSKSFHFRSDGCEAAMKFKIEKERFTFRFSF